MSIKSELHEAILRKGGKIPTHGGIAAALDELNRLPSGGGAKSWNDLTDKPFGTEIGMVEVLGETTVEPSEGAAIMPNRIGLVVGNSYTVTWNGAVYECVAQHWESDEMHGAVLGDNGALTGGTSTGEPFAIMDYSVETAAQMGFAVTIAPLDGSTTVTLSIHTEGEIVKQIDEKYLPFGIEFSGKVILPETVFELEENGAQIALQEAAELIVGKTYTVVVDGCIRTVKATTQVIDEGIEVGVCLESIGDTGDCVILTDVAPDFREELGVPAMLTLTSFYYRNTVTLMIAEGEPIVTPIQTDILPKFEINFLCESDGVTWHCDKPFAELFRAYRARKTICGTATYGDETVFILTLSRLDASDAIFLCPTYAGSSDGLVSGMMFDFNSREEVSVRGKIGI